MFWHCPCGSLGEYWWESALCCIIAAGHIKSHRANWRPALPLASLSLTVSFSVGFSGLSVFTDPNEALCPELLLSLHFSCALWKLWADTLLSWCVCVCSGRSVGATSPQCPPANYIQSEAIKRAGARAGKARLQLSALSLFYWQLYTSVSAHWAPPFLVSRIPSDTKRCELTLLYCCLTYPSQSNAFHK